MGFIIILAYIMYIWLYTYIAYCSVARNTTDLIDPILVLEVIEVRINIIIITTKFYPLIILNVGCYDCSGQSSRCKK